METVAYLYPDGNGKHGGYTNQKEKGVCTKSADAFFTFICTQGIDQKITRQIRRFPTCSRADPRTGISVLMSVTFVPSTLTAF